MTTLDQRKPQIALRSLKKVDQPDAWRATFLILLLVFSLVISPLVISPLSLKNFCQVFKIKTNAEESFTEKLYFSLIA